MKDLLASLRYAVRQFAHARTWTATAVLTLALGIGGTTAIFTLIQAVILRSLPVADPASLYRIGSGDDCCVESGVQDDWGMFSYPLYERLKAATPEFAELAAFQAGPGRVGVRRDLPEATSQPMRLEYVTGNYFSTFGVGALVGRVLTAEDDAPSAAPVAVISHHTWQTLFGGDRSVVGSLCAFDSHLFTVVGIAAPGFFGDTLQGDPPDLWVPVGQEPIIDGESALLHQSPPAWLRVIGRLKPGASVAGMAPRLTALLRTWIQTDSGYPANWMPDIIRGLPKQSIAVIPAGSGVEVLRAQYERSLQMLMAVCGVVLLIACANVANLLLARAVTLRTQTAVRLAMGATAGDIVRHALVESLLLAGLGALTGLAVAFGTANLLLKLAFTHARYLPIATHPSLIVVAFAAGLAVITGLVFGAFPAWFATRTDPIEALRGAGRGTSDRSSRLRRALVIIQATFSVVLLAGATMLARSLGHLEDQNFGYHPEGRVVVGFNRLPASYSPDKLNAVYRAIEDRLARLPGVSGEGLALYNPLTDNWGEMILVLGHPAPTSSDNTEASWDRVSTHYLANFGVRILRGRGFTEADNEHAAPVAVVNDAFVRRFFKTTENPLDQHFGMDLPANAGTYRIIGVVEDAKFAGFALDKPARPMFYVPLSQTVNYPDPLMGRVEISSHFIHAAMLVTTMAPGALEPVLTKTLAEVDPNLTITSVRTMQQSIALAFDEERAVAALASLFGVVALVLAAVGLYGVVAQSVALRAGEIGVRMALGADRGAIVGLILGGALTRVLLGLALGVPLAVGAGHLIASRLYGVAYWDPVALAVAGGALGLAALLAALIPALRAGAISPMRVLRGN